MDSSLRDHDIRWHRVDDEKLKSKPAGLLLEHLSWRCECVAKENKTAIRVCYLQLSKGWHVLQISPPINPILHGGFAFENIEKVLQTNTVLAAGRSVDSRSGWDKSNENMAKEESPRLISNSMYTCTQEARKVNADTDEGLQEESPIVCIKPRSALVLCITDTRWWFIRNTKMFWSEWAFLPDHSSYSASLLGMVKDFFSNITQEGLICWNYNGTDQITAAEATRVMTKDKQT